MNYSAFYDFFTRFGTDSKSKPFIHKEEGKISLCFDFTATQSSMIEADPYRLALGYTRTMMACLLFNPRPSHIGMIGLGGGSLAKYCYRYIPDACIAVAEINPDVISHRSDFLIPPDDERLMVHCCDGAKFIAETATSYDWLMVDGFDINGQAPSLATHGFYQDCHAALNSGGVLVANLDSQDPAHEEYVDNMRRCFDSSVLVIRSEDHSNQIAFAVKDTSAWGSGREWLARAHELDPSRALNLQKSAKALQEAMHKDRLPLTDSD